MYIVHVNSPVGGLKVLIGDTRSEQLHLSVWRNRIVFSSHALHYRVARDHVGFFVNRLKAWH